MSFDYNIVNLNAQHLNFIAGLAGKKAAARHLSITELAQAYNHKSPAIAKIMLLIILPLTALALKILFYRSKKYFFDYLVLATEASCIILYLDFLILPALLMIAGWLLKYLHLANVNFVTDQVSLPIALFYIIYWNTHAFRLFFKIPLKYALGKGLLFLFLQSVIIFIIYRLILFLTVLAFI